ncbi:Gfo/Idh/MocA family protein [Streptomyces sp. ISL-99]|uniref:Gfo/Idh/MocA family protein n=1 Tax=Streptomyces sp. ISL-99 TaxID=2819193 RepID=UPI001BE7E23C|nr:Gfo/Idh/MocA family oxidoreductase [Streptomyces sp. ISL-99]
MRVAVVGAGRMAAVRTQALADVEGVEICGVASRRPERARRFAARFDVGFSSGRYQELMATAPDAVLVEAPHRVQDDVVRWALENGLHVLVGGCLAADLPAAREVRRLAAERRLVVEAGYEARYKEVWRRAAALVGEGAVGEVLCIQSTALVDQDPASWYYDQAGSGGMFVTHLSYAFLNPLRWLFGMPLTVAAVSNRKVHTHPGAVEHETCVATLTFAGDVLCTATAGYVKPAALSAWSVRILGSAGSLDMMPGDDDPGHLLHFPRQGAPRPHTFENNTAFHEQARAFVGAVRGQETVSNPPEDAILDLHLCELIADSAARGGTPLRARP